MKALIIDHDPEAAALMQARLADLGVTATTATRQETIDGSNMGAVDMVFVDPAPLKNAKSMVVAVRKKISHYTSVILLGAETSFEIAIAAGANDALPKPFNQRDVAERVDSAGRLLKIIRLLDDASFDYPSGGGVIAKSAFYQLFLSAIERTERYGEKSCVLFLSFLNYAQISVQESTEVAVQAAKVVLGAVLDLRRQTDILGQIGDHEYALLLQRPNYETEPVEAALRFADQLSNLRALGVISKTPVELLVQLVEIPSGRLMAEHGVTIAPNVP